MKNIEFYKENLKNFCVTEGIVFLKIDDEKIMAFSLQSFIDWLSKEHPILDDVEKKYLENIIRPFAEKVRFIAKIRRDDYERIIIHYVEHGLTCFINLPSFKEGTMYKGMKPNEEYKLEELGL